MKDPKAFFPFLFASSWLGDLLLTILAFFLAFTHEGPLSPLLFLTVALCILAGNILPIGSYYLLIKWRAAELEAEAAQASLRVRDALRRSEDVVARLDEAEGALSKAILIGRQLPEKIGERFKAVEDLTEHLNTLEISSFSETLKEGTNAVESLREKTGEIRAAVQKLEKKMGSLPKSLSEAVTDALPKERDASAGEADISLGERLDLVYESLEAVQDSLDGLLGRVSKLAEARAAAPVQSEPTADETVEDRAQPWEPLAEGVAEAEPDTDEPELETRDLKETEEPEESLPETAGPEIAGPEIEAHQEEILVAHPEETDVEKDAIAGDRARLSVQAMVGISNKLFVRGDEPWLSWDEGRQMDLVGIGEYAFELGDLKESIEVAVLLNDDIESDAGRITLEPGKVVRIHPTFPR